MKAAVASNHPAIRLSPPTAIYDGIGNAVFSVKSVGVPRAAANLSDLFGGQLIARMARPVDPKLDLERVSRMAQVFAMGYILKVFDPVVVANTVLVIDNLSVRARAKECFGHKAVNVTSVAKSKVNGWITTYQSGPKNSAGPRSWTRSLATNAAKIGNGILWVVVANLPNFCRMVFGHDGLLSRSLCLGPRGASTPCRPVHFIGVAA